MNLKEKYQKEVTAKLKEEYGYTNNFEVPRILKVTLNVGIGKSKDDPKFAETAENTLKRITGQSPVYTISKKSIAAFKLREGMKVGLKVTLRGQRMWDFLEKLIGVALPRVRDFRGLSVNIVDQKGNLNLGFREHIVFPEIKSDEVEKLHGLEVAVTTTAETKEEGIALFKYLGFPFKEEESKK
ncbi:MAG: 50S ribosomal protein L5 [Candidatus Komeilibacteria bacterium CG10_big_fil_rev_8_21_14_0_10_41_13]|uniref:Large ribosomal subunit protein uL5 n=1 Tax=Candidatus Komeilibacteria bacterium CG10_big_fil_rev_8_21_14_0_10_41_13 TaxID=1974476 RepID=A0A2M6WDC9_9BACT|nr:MAG: 50S ribosomal protein L5 [Candidatus Komeilibacteria bacterium CG10_big_fil_rev_8_21_14_0_10_41_13]